jgi:two-component system cell cycle response regulator DivK
MGSSASSASRDMLVNLLTQTRPETSLMPKILLVEDNELNRDMLSRRLTKRGYDVSIAGDGAEALTTVGAERPDLILMDMSLPVMTGWEATTALKQDPDTKAIPVIALTAHAMSGDREKAIEAGCDEFETKPVELPRLLEKMRVLLGEDSPE